MMANISKLNIVRLGSSITFSSLKEIGNSILNSFRGIIEEFNLSHHDTPVIESIDAELLTMVLAEAFRGYTLGITDADLKTGDEDEFYSSIFGGKNPKNNVAVVSTRKLCPHEIVCERDYELYVDRTLKVSLHEVGHNFGLTDHASYKVAHDGMLCPMSKGEFNKFGYLGYVKAIIDGRGPDFCDECTYFLHDMHALRSQSTDLLEDGIDLPLTHNP